ncbi:MAG: FKBP-type peptidyl-prolyl cis-trans isomerase [Candidatus Limimorpha sp.]
MNRSLRLLPLVALILVLGACSRNSIYSGFKKMDNGAYMKYYVKGEGTTCPRINDGIVFSMAQYLNDSLIYTTAGSEPVELILQKHDFVGDINDVLQLMHVGDSVAMVFLSDSIFTGVVGEEVPDNMVGQPLYYHLKLLSITPYEQREAEYKLYIDDLMAKEQLLIDSCKAVAKFPPTASGLLILDRKGGNNKPVRSGSFVNLDFTLCDPDGDTLMSTVGREQVEFQYGTDEFLCKGFNEGLGMLSKGESMRFVIPSSLAFDSIGYQAMILPYTPLLVDLKLNDVMDAQTFEKKQQEKKAKRMAKEQGMISEYLSKNDITVAPTESGLYFVLQQQGQGENAQSGDTVSIHYVISNLKGNQIESSYELGLPMPFVAGQEQMLGGIDEAVMKMNVGSKALLVMPSDLGFGEFEFNHELLPSGSPLRIDLEVVEIR